ncbi:MAG: hypothetical protein ACNS61_06715 [Candidatus Wenzhouxiangella sp. M2_3B_020]
MKTKWIALAVPALLALGIAGAAEAGGYGHGKGHHGYSGNAHYGYGHFGHPGFRQGYRHPGRGYKGYRHGYRSGYRPGYRAYRHGYRKGYRHGHRYGQRRSYYPDAYRYDPYLGIVRGIYHPYARGGISLHFGY